MPEVDPPEVVIRPIAGTEHISPREVWRFREMFWSLIKRDVRTKFNNTKFGALWACSRPLIMVVIMVVIRRYSQSDWPEALPFPLFFYSGIVFWFFLCDCMSDSMNSVQKDAGLMSKVFYPRIISPIVPLISNLVELAFAFLPLIAFMIYFSILPGWTVLLLPLVFIVSMIGALAMGLIFATLSLERQDWGRVFGLLLYVGLFAAPIFTSFQVLPEHIYNIALLNPTVGLLEAFRAGLDPETVFPWRSFGISAGVITLLLAIGVTLFYRTQQSLLDKL